MACLLKIYLQKNHEVPKTSHSRRRIKTSGWCAQYIQELMADLDNIQIWKVEKMQDKEVQGSKSNLNFKVIFFVVIRFSYQDW